MRRAGLGLASSREKISIPFFRNDRLPCRPSVTALPVLCRCRTGGRHSKSSLLGGSTVAKKKAAKKKVAKKVAKKSAKKGAKKAAKK